MNIIHLKYAIEVEKTGSISRAAENLYMGQPHLSKAIRDLEESLGIAIFERTPKGVTPTPKGREFLENAKRLVNEIDALESKYRSSPEENQKFDISVPRASYISNAFTELVKELNLASSLDINYRETNSVKTIKNVANNINNLGIIRFRNIYENYFLNLLNEKSLKFNTVWEFEYAVLMSENHPLAKKEKINPSELSEYTEIVHGDLSVSLSEDKKCPGKARRISVYERASQMELLSRIPTAYMWVSPIPSDILSRFSLVQKKCAAQNNKCKDVLIYRKGYHFSETDKIFMEKLKQVISGLSAL